MESYIDLLYRVPDELRKEFRKYEKISKKVQNLEWSRRFNSSCIKESMLPDYSITKNIPLYFFWVDSLHTENSVNSRL